MALAVVLMLMTALAAVLIETRRTSGQGTF